MLLIKNHQRKTKINSRLLRRMTRSLMRDLLHIEEYELTVCIVGEKEMTRLNEKHLGHAGSTDVITFDYGFTGPERKLVGEVFVCMDEAAVQAARYSTSWQSELARYVIHGALHLAGYDDKKPAARRIMKRQENRLLELIDAEFNVSKLAGAGVAQLLKGSGKV